MSKRKILWKSLEVYDHGTAAGVYSWPPAVCSNVNYITFGYRTTVVTLLCRMFSDIVTDISDQLFTHMRISRKLLIGLPNGEVES